MAKGTEIAHIGDGNFSPTYRAKIEVVNPGRALLYYSTWPEYFFEMEGYPPEPNEFEDPAELEGGKKLCSCISPTVRWDCRSNVPTY